MTDSQPSRSLAHLAELSGVTPDSELATLTADTLQRARWARKHNDSHPSGAWSTGEQLAVALVLDDQDHLAGMQYTAAEAASRVTGGMYFPIADLDAWLADVRGQLDEN